MGFKWAIVFIISVMVIGWLRKWSSDDDNEGTCILSKKAFMSNSEIEGVSTASFKLYNWE